MRKRVQTINLSILDFKVLESDEIIVTINSINLSILDFKALVQTVKNLNDYL